MGYYSVITILHDQLSGITKHPKEFVKDLERAILSFTTASYHERTIKGGGGMCNPAKIIAQEHADTFRMLVVGSNTAWDLGVCGRWSQHFRDNMSEEERIVSWLKRVASENGYELKKKRKT